MIIYPIPVDRHITGIAYRVYPRPDSHIIDIAWGVTVKIQAINCGPIVSYTIFKTPADISGIVFCLSPEIILAAMNTTGIAG
jgi:hypothetical protein